jgi:hypothetical protein
MLNGKIHYKWPISIAMLVYQRVSAIDLNIYRFLDQVKTSRLAELCRLCLPGLRAQEKRLASGILAMKKHGELETHNVEWRKIRETH